MKHILQLPIFLLMLWASGGSYATHGVVYHPPEKEVVYLPNVGLTSQLLDNIDDDTRTKIQLAALVSAAPEIGISLVEAVSAKRLLRKKYPSSNPATLSANEVRLALAQRDLEGFDAAWNFVRTNPRGADAWEMFLTGNVDESIRKSKVWLEKLVDDLSHPKWGTEISSFLDESPSDINIWKALKDNPNYHWELYNSDGFTAGSRWEKWSQREFFKAKTQQGTAFENAMLNSIKARTGSAYNDLRNLVNDLDDRLLLSQVQFCRPGFSPPCNNAGEYFVADQVWVKFDADTREVIDMVVVDSKLSQSTAFTPGQTAAKNHVGGKLSYKPVDSRIRDIDNVVLPSPITQGTEIEIKSFHKLYGDGSGNYLGIQ